MLQINSGKGVNVIINRTIFGAKQTLGQLSVYDENDDFLFQCKTLELPFLNNQNQVSCIPNGCYRANKTVHAKFGKCIFIFNVSKRTGIYIHSGNYYNQILGCVLVGKHFKDINNDNLRDVVLSRDTLNDLYYIVDERFTLWVNSVM